jgi:NADH:ubiquinone reductase (H+-translocating)
MAPKTHHVVIIGGGFGGLTAARSLQNAPVRVTLVDKRNFHLFQPLLYQVATGLLCPSEITSPLRHVLRNQKNAEVLMGEVTDIDVEGKRVILADGEITYDTLIVAPGMVSHYYGHDEWEKWAPGLKTIEDTGRIRQRIFSAFEIAEREPDPVVRREWLTFAVIGSGATGIELSGMIGEIAHNTLKDEFRSIRPEEARILLLDAADRILPTYPRGLSRLAEKSLNRLGIETLTHARVVEINEQGILVEKPEGSTFIRARTIVWTSGVAASPLGRILAEKTGSGLDKLGRISVTPDLTIPGHPEVFVIGDLASCPGKGGKPLPGLAPVATQHGRFAAKAIRARLDGKALPVRFRYFDKGTMAVIGRGSAVADIRKWHFGGRFAWFLWLFIHLFLIIQFQNRIIVLIRWAFQYFTYNRGARNLMLRGPLKLPLTRPGDAPGPGG